MTSVAKAKELYCKYTNVLNIRDLQTTANPFAKQCALIAVDEMLYTVDGLEDSVWSISASDFLKEVKQELEKL